MAVEVSIYVAEVQSAAELAACQYTWFPSIVLLHIEQGAEGPPDISVKVTRGWPDK